MPYKCLVHLVDETTGAQLNYLGVVEFQHRPMKSDELASAKIYELLPASLQKQHPGKTVFFQITKVRLMEGRGIVEVEGEIDDTYLVVFGHL